MNLPPTQPRGVMCWVCKEKAQFVLSFCEHMHPVCVECAERMAMHVDFRWDVCAREYVFLETGQDAPRREIACPRCSEISPSTCPPPLCHTGMPAIVLHSPPSQKTTGAVWFRGVWFPSVFAAIDFWRIWNGVDYHCTQCNRHIKIPCLSAPQEVQSGLAHTCVIKHNHISCRESFASKRILSPSISRCAF